MAVGLKGIHIVYKLENYQERAVQDLIDNKYHYLALEMSIGKTLIVLDYLRRTKQKALVVAPLLVAQRTWPQEVEKWGFPFSVEILHGKNKVKGFESDADIKIINYDGLQWLKKHCTNVKGFGDLQNRVLVLDESTCLKTPGSARFKIMKAMRPLFKKGIVCLSGTPMPGGYTDLWSQYFMLDGGAALEKSYSAFKKTYFFESGPPRWIVEIKPGAAETINKLVTPMTTVLRTKDYMEMPPVLYRTKDVVLPDNVMYQYHQLKKHYVLEHGDNIYSADSAGVLVNKLRQVTQGGLYDEEGIATHLHTAKLEALKELMESAEGSPILCPIAFKFEVAMIHQHLGKDIPCIAGGMSISAKEKILNEWDKGNVPLLLCHPASLSHGLNMQIGGNTLCWYGMPWSLEHYHQLNGRLARRGQMNTVVVWHLTAKGTIDSRLSKVLACKAATQENFKQAVLDEIRA